MAIPCPALMRKALRLAACWTAVGLAAEAPAASAAAPPAVQKVDIRNSSFVPGEITIAPGTTVVWINHDEMPHTVTGNDKTFASKGLDTGDEFRYTFGRDGNFAYHCAIHPYMKGVVHVRR